MSTTQVTLKEQLDNRRHAFSLKASQEIQDLYEEGVQAVADDGIVEQAINVGDTAPAFTLKNAAGNDVSLSDYLEKGNVVLTWYRGGWCPYCNLTLKALQDLLPDFNSAGAHLLALTPELPDNSLSTSEKNELSFEVLTDYNNEVAKTYNLVFKLISGVAASYKKAFDLEKYNGVDTDELPLAATYVINQEGVVTYAFLDAEYRNRAEPSEVLAAVQALS